MRPPAAGSVPPIYTKGATVSYWRAGWPVCGGGVGQAGGCAARRQGKGLDVRPCRGAGGKVGRFLPKAPEWVRSERTRSLPGGGRPERAAKAGKGGRLGDRGPIWGTPVRGGLLVGNCVLLARCPHLYDSDYFPRQGKIIVVEHISPDRPPTRALMRRSYRTPSIPTPSYPGLHPGLVCRAPLGHTLG